MSTFNENMADETEDASEGEVGELATDSLEAGLEPAASDDPKTREYYIQQLPLTPEDIQASNIIIEDGLYNMAMIYKDKLEDIRWQPKPLRNWNAVSRSIVTFWKATTRFI